VETLKFIGVSASLFLINGADSNAASAFVQATESRFSLAVRSFCANLLRLIDVACIMETRGSLSRAFHIHAPASASVKQFATTRLPIEDSLNRRRKSGVIRIIELDDT